MFKRISAICSGMHFRFLSLIFAVAAVLLCAQLTVETISDLRQQRSEYLNRAFDISSVMARSLEPQFEVTELHEMEAMLSAIRLRDEVQQLSLVDKDRTFYLDGDPVTSPLMAHSWTQLQEQVLKTANTSHEVTDKTIRVGEPLKLGGNVLGVVTIAFKNPSLGEMLAPVLLPKLMMLLPILFIGLLLATRLVNQITAPLAVLSKKAKRIADGDFDARVRVKGASEVVSVARSFNLMASTVRRHVAEIYDLAYIDRTTNLPNREYFRNELLQAIKTAQENDGMGALLFLDLYGFKRVNDTFGHEFGDRLLRQFAERLSNFLDKQAKHSDALISHKDRKDQTNFFSRLGGDEFTILCRTIETKKDAEELAKNAIAIMEEPFYADEIEVKLGVSVGISFFPRDDESHQTVMKHADMAMYQAKRLGKNTFQVFDDELDEEAGFKMEMENELRKAVEAGELSLHYQPKIQLADGTAAGAEALLRWQHPEKGMISPGIFIPIAENTGLIHPLGRFVLETACAKIAQLCATAQPTTISVNVSVQQFERPDFADIVLDVVRKSGIEAKYLMLEITESHAMSHFDQALEHIETLRRAGIRFSMDDFGTGYSNLAQLGRLPFDELKIDRSFVNQIGSDQPPHKHAMIDAIIALSHSMGYKVVAEGVETQEQVAVLRKAGCEVAQGFLYARPMADKDFSSWLKDNHSKLSGKRSGKTHKSAA